MEDFVRINDLEVLTLAILEGSRKKVSTTTPTYEIIPAENGADMLSWKGNVQIQDITHGFWRVGAIGDGNCLLHSFMTAASPTYRMQNMTTRQHIVDEFRKVLVARMDDIRDQMDMLYFEIGGASALEDSLRIITKRRAEIGLEVAPAIAHLYGFNFLAIGINDLLEWRAYCQTMQGFDADMPTVLIHYMGAGANFAERKHGFSEAGHYEVIVRPTFPEAAAAGGAGRASTRSKSKGSTTEFDEVHTSYMLTAGDLAYVLDLFTKQCKGANKYVHPLEREGGPRRTASGQIMTGSSGSRRSVKRTASGRTSSGTRKRSGGGGRTPTPRWG